MNQSEGAYGCRKHEIRLKYEIIRTSLGLAFKLNLNNQNDLCSR